MKLFVLGGKQFWSVANFAHDVNAMQKIDPLFSDTVNKRRDQKVAINGTLLLA